MAGKDGTSASRKTGLHYLAQTDNIHRPGDAFCLATASYPAALSPMHAAPSHFSDFAMYMNTQESFLRIRSEQERDKEIARERSEREKEMAKIRLENEKEIAKIRAENEKGFMELKLKFQSESEKGRSEREKEIARLRLDHEKEMMRIRTEHDKEMATLRQAAAERKCKRFAPSSCSFGLRCTMVKPPGRQNREDANDHAHRAVALARDQTGARGAVEEKMI